VLDLVIDELLRRRLRRELVGRREEKALDPASVLTKGAGTFAAFDATAYALPESFGVTFRLVLAIWRTSATRCTISLRVKPSGRGS
jgi:hypothetical protein